MLSVQVTYLSCEDVMRYGTCLKGLSHELDLAFDDMYFLGLNRGRQGHFLNF